MLEMSFCNEKGIPHSHFLGGPNIWQPEDRAKALAFALEAASRCTLCGTAPWEWEENRFAYEPEEKHCHGCYLKQSYSQSLDSALPGTTVELVPVTPKRRAEQQLLAEKRRRMMEDA